MRPKSGREDRRGLVCDAVAWLAVHFFVFWYFISSWEFSGPHSGRHRRESSRRSFGFGPLPALGPAGAGWGLVIPFGAGSVVMICYLRSSRAIIRLKFREMMPRWELFADILKVGVPGLINTAITNLSVVVLTGIAGQLGPEAAIGYAMGARLEYILQPVAFGFGTAIVAMVGTNWGGRQYRRAWEIAWTGATTVAVLCGTIGLIVAFHPGLWMGLFSDDADVARFGALY